MPPVKKGVYGERGDRSDEYTPAKAKYMKEWRDRNREKVREYNRKSYHARRFLWKRTPCTKEEYDRALEEQKGLCAICRQPETHKMHGKVRPLAIDHDHETGKFRALLCMSCNTGLGKFKDNTIFLLRARKYLLKHREESNA